MTGTALALDDIDVVDNHCHALLAELDPGVEAWRALFTESPDPQMRAVHASRTAFHGRLVRRLAAVLGVEPTEAAVVAARGTHDQLDLAGTLFREARVGAVVVDTGFPDPAAVLPADRFAAVTGATYATLLRVELLLQDLVAASSTYAETVDRLREALADVRALGHCGLKSIVGYRTGLGVTSWTAEQTDAAFADARREVDRTGRVRLGHKPLLDSLLHVVFDLASAQELPLQFHVGYGDPDADLRSAAPLELREVLEQPRYRGMPIVLLHGCWPYVREGAYLASVYGNVHLDVSYAIPFLSSREMLQMTRAALSVCPTSKLMYSSDGVRVPELHWMGAIDGRLALGTALGELVADGDLDAGAARTAGEAILRDNATHLYGLDARTVATA